MTEIEKDINMDGGLPVIEDVPKEPGIEIKYEDPLHPTLEITNSRGKIVLQNATIILELNVGCNTQNPPLQLEYNLVKKEVDKITFKYSLSNWTLQYGMRVDTIKKGCYKNGNPCIILNMPYAIYNIDQARELLISYCTELLSLLKIEYAVLYFDIRNAYGIKCTYGTEGELIHSSVEDYKLDRTFSAIINAGIVTVSTELQEAMIELEKANSTNYFVVPMYVYTKSYTASAANSILTVSIVQNHAKYTDINKYERSVKKILDDSMLSFTNLTII